MAISAGKIYGFSLSTPEDQIRFNPVAIQRVEYCGGKHLSSVRLNCLYDDFGSLNKYYCVRNGSRFNVISCMSTGTRTSKAKESRKQVADGKQGVDSQLNDRQGIAEACKYACNDAKFVNERARNDMVILSRGITRLNDRARHDAAVLAMEMLRLDARAREDTEKIEYGWKNKAARLHVIAEILKETASSKLKRVADQHWSNGALEADLRRADGIARRRAMEDAFLALQFVRNIHDIMERKQQLKEDGTFTMKNVMGYVTLERNGKTVDPFPEGASMDRIEALKEAYWSMASALSEADGIDYTDPDELELLIATLIDLDAMDGKGSVSLLIECSRSPDVKTRKALANALGTAPSIWTIGNAGMGALQRLSEDSNTAVAAAASAAIDELRKQWEIEDGDSLTFGESADSSERKI